MHSRKTKVGRCRIGKVGTNRTKNICKHSSRKTDVMELDLTAAVTLDDCILNERMPEDLRGEDVPYQAGHHFRHITHRLMALARWNAADRVLVTKRAGRTKIGD